MDRAKNKKDRLAAVATLAYEVTLVQTGFLCRPNAFIGYLRKYKAWPIVNKIYRHRDVLAPHVQYISIEFYLNQVNNKL